MINELPTLKANIGFFENNKIQIIKFWISNKNVLKVHVMKKLEYLLGDTVNHPGAEVQRSRHP